MYKTLKVRIKDKHKSILNQMAKDVNAVFNFSQDLSLKILRKERRFASAYDIAKYTSGSSKELSINSQTIQAVTEEYTTRRKQFKKSKLRWRASYGKQKALGWIPFKAASIRYKQGQLVYNKQHFSVWDSFGLAEYDIKSGCFVQDARNRWYACLVVKVNPTKPTGQLELGIDLGLKDLATCSDGTVVANPKYFRCQQEKLAKAQRASKKKLARAIHAKIKNSRQDYLQKESTKLVERCKKIVVGNLNLKASKSVNDTSFAGFRTMLRYKCEHARVTFQEVSEYLTTQTCSDCGSCSSSQRPKGIAGLGIRVWTCSDCGAIHDRDVNAAKNILAAGHCRLAVGIPLL